MEKKFRISSPERMVYHRLKFKRHCSNIEVFIPDKYKSKTQNEFNNLPMVKKLNREPYFEITENTFLSIFSYSHYYTIILLFSRFFII